MNNLLKLAIIFSAIIVVQLTEKCDIPGTKCSSHEKCCDPTHEDEKEAGHRLYKRCVASNFKDWQARSGKCAWVKEYSRSKYDYIYLGTDSCVDIHADCGWYTDCCGEIKCVTHDPALYHKKCGGDDKAAINRKGAKDALTKKEATAAKVKYDDTSNIYKI